MQIEIKTYAFNSETLVIVNTEAKTCEISAKPGDRTKALALLAFSLASISPATKDVVPEVPALAVGGRNPIVKLTALVAKPDPRQPGLFQEIYRFDPGKLAEFEESRRDTIIEALGSAIGFVTMPDLWSNQPEAQPAPLTPDTSIEPVGPRFGLPLHTAESIAATIERPAGKASSRSKASA